MKIKTNLLLGLFTILVFIPIILAFFSLSAPVNVSAQEVAFIGSPTPPPIGTPFPSVELPHTMELVEDIYPGATSGYPLEFIEFMGELVFSANGENGSGNTIGNELFVYDGTEVSLIADIYPDWKSATPLDFAIYNNDLYFSALGKNLADEDVGRELFRYNGVSVELVEDFSPGSISSNPMDMTVFNGELYFISSTSVDTQTGYALTKYDGNQISVVPGTPIGETNYFPSAIFTFDGSLYFIGYKDQPDPHPDFALFEYDGSDFTEIADIAIVEKPVEYNGWLYFSGSLFAWASYTGTELYRFNGTTIELIGDIYPGASSSYPSSLTVWNGNLYFFAYNNLYEFDGSTISPLDESYPWLGYPPDSVASSSITTNGSALFFDGRYYDYINNAIFWGFYRFDGTQVEFIDKTYYQSNLSSFGDDLIINTDDGSGIGSELWTLPHDPDKITHTNITNISPSPIQINEPVTVYVSVTTEGSEVPTGFVDVGDGQGTNCQVTLENGAGTCDLTFTAYGEHQIIARFELGTPYYSSSDATTIQLKSDNVPPEGSIQAPIQGGNVKIPKDLLIVEASDQDSAVKSVTFEAYYNGSWHILFTDEDESDGWVYTWSTQNLDKQEIMVRATILDAYDNPTILTVDQISLGGPTVIDGGYHARGEESRQPTETNQEPPILGVEPFAEEPTPPAYMHNEPLKFHKVQKIQLKQPLWPIYTLKVLEFPY